MKKVTRKLAQGFTLVEMMIYLGLFSMFLAVLTNIFVSSLDVKLESAATSAVVQDGRYILSRLAYDAGRAAAVSVPTSLGEETTSLQMTIDGETYTYSLVGNNLTVTSPGLAGNLNSEESKVNSVTFRKVGNVGGVPSIQVNLSLESLAQIRGKTETRDLQTTVGLRWKQ